MLEIGITSFLVALSGALVPGPLFVLTVAETLRRGVLAGPLIVLGHMIAELLVVVLLVKGVGKYLLLPAVSTVMGYVGGSVLILMGIGAVLAAVKGQLSVQPGESGVQGGLWGPTGAGVLGSVSNPYWLLWWATVGAQYVGLSLPYGTMGVTSFFTGHILADLSWYSLVGLFVAGGRNLVGSRGYSVALGTCGLFLFGLGAYFIAT